MTEVDLDEPTLRLLHLLRDRGRLQPYAPWHLVAYDKAAAAGVAELVGGAIVLTAKGRQAARARFGGKAHGPAGPSEFLGR